MMVERMAEIVSSDAASGRSPKASWHMTYVTPASTTWLLSVSRTVEGDPTRQKPSSKACSNDFGAPDIAAMDLFVVPTIGFDLLYAFVIVRLDRRDLVWINVTANPTAEWVARQITEAFPWDEAPRHLIRDRDRIYGSVVTRRLRAMGIRDKPTAPASPWQNGFVERLIGSIRRECLDHIIVFSEAHLRRILKSSADYYNSVRTHRSLHKDAPISRPIHQTGVIRSQPILGGLHHHYVRV